MGQLENRYQARMAVRRFMADQLIKTLRQVVDDNDRYRSLPGADDGAVTGLAAVEEVMDLYERTATPVSADQDDCTHTWPARPYESAMVHVGRATWCMRCYVLMTHATADLDMVAV